MSRTKTHGVLVLAVLALALGATNVAADTQSPLVGRWACTGQNGGVTYASTFDYRPDGTYVSTQRISAGDDSVEGGGGGTWRFENGVLHDTKLRATLDRFVRDGAEVPSSDPQWQTLYRQSQENLGVATSAEVRIQGDVAQAGGLACQRQR